MSLRPLSCALALTLLGGCASMIETVPTGDQTYRVTYNAGMKLQTWVEVKLIARQQAEAHCESLGQRLSQPRITSNHATGLLPKKAFVDFTCTDKPVPKASGSTGA